MLTTNSPTKKSSNDEALSVPHLYGATALGFLIFAEYSLGKCVLVNTYQ